MKRSTGKAKAYTAIQQRGIAAGILMSVLVLGGVWWWYGERGSVSSNTQDVWRTLFGSGSGVADEKSGHAQSAWPGLENLETYTSAAYHFSVRYPEGYTVETYDEGEGAMTFLFRGAQNLPEFQVYVEPIEEKGIGLVTPSEVHRAFPTLTIENPQYIAVTDVVKGLLFMSEAPGIGRTREVWIAAYGFLYQITARAEYDGWLAGIMRTWTFLLR